MLIRRLTGYWLVSSGETISPLDEQGEQVKLTI